MASPDLNFSPSTLSLCFFTTGEFKLLKHFGVRAVSLKVKLKIACMLLYITGLFKKIVLLSYNIHTLK